MLFKSLRIRHYIASIVGACLLGGVLSWTLLTALHSSVEERQRELQEHSATLQEIYELRRAVGEWTTMVLDGCDDPALLEAAAKRADGIRTRSERVASDTLAYRYAAELTLVNEYRVLTLEGIECAANLNASDPRYEEQRAELLTGMRALVTHTGDAVDRVRAHIERGIADVESTVEARRRRLSLATWIVGAAYAGLIVGLWRWTVRCLIVPVQTLTRESRAAAEEGTPFHLVPDGPVEVRQLTESLTKLFGDLVSARDHLEEKVRLRTEELERSSRVKSEFLANMSHEIRTPMTAILGHAELCKDPETSVDEFRRHLEIICINGEHLLTVMNDILDVSRIEAGRMPVERTLCSPTKIVSEAVAMMEGQAHEKALEVHVQSVGTIPEMIETDPTRLRQILLNVIGNAVKFTESGAIELTLTMSVADGGGQRLAFEIRDSGVGMAPDKLDSVFEPFVQADTSTTREYGGTGLGLSISRAFARMLGGDLTCESEEGAGSRFLLTIDPGDLDGVAFIEVEGCVDFVDAPLPARAESESQTFEGRALVVEDVAVNRRLICRLLTKAGLEVEEAENGQVGFDKAMESFSQGRPFDVVFMDLQMPVLDGYDATRRLRDQGYPGLIVALTAHTMPEERERCLAAGCDDFATKPIDRAAFMELLASLAQDASERPAGGAGGLLAVSVKPRRK